MWRWLAGGRARDDARPHFEVDEGLRRRLAFWRGNVVAVHRELTSEQAAGGPAAPSLATLYRAVNRQLPPGERAACAKASTRRAGMTCSCNVRRGTATKRGKPITSRRRWRWTSTAGW